MRMLKDRNRSLANRKPSPRRFAPTCDVLEDRRLLAANLHITLGLSDNTPDIGQNVTFTIGLANSNATGTQDATSIQVKDLLPTGLTFVSSTPSQGSYSSGTGVWAAGTVAKGASASLSIVAQVILGGTSTDFASITSLTETNIGSPTTASQTYTPNEVQLFIAMGLDSPTPNIQNNTAGGDHATFTIAVSNSAGYENATGVTISDVLPSGLHFVSSTASSGSYNSGTGIWNVGSLNQGTGATLQIVVTDTSLSTITNTATITHVNELDANATSSRSTSQDITAQEVSMSVTETADNLAPGVNSVVTFTTTVSNAVGFSKAQGVFVAQNLPAGLQFNSATASRVGVTYNPNTGGWNVGDLNPGETLTLTLKASVVTIGTRTVTSTANANRINASANFSASVTLVPPQINLNVTASVDNPQPNVGDNITFTIKINNAAGFTTATNTKVQVTNPLPVGLTFVNAVAPAGTSFSSATGVWTIGTLASGSNLTLTLTTNVTTPAVKVLTATASANQTDANLSPSASVTVIPLNANLAITQTVDTTTPNVGGQVVFTIALNESAGFSKVTNVQVTDLLPAGLTFVQSIPSQGSYNPATGVWTAGTIAGGGGATLRIVAIDNVPLTPITNTSTITHVDQPNQGSTTSASTTVTAQQVNLTISNTVDHPSPQVGDNVTFTISVHNVGASNFSNASDVQVSDLLPVGLTFVSATASQGTYNGLTGFWSVGPLLKSSQATLQIVALVTLGGTTTNTATITDAVPHNANVNNSASASVTAPVASVTDLSQISYLINGTRTVATLSGNVQRGDTVQATFTVAAGHTDFVSLAGYIVPTSGLGLLPTPGGVLSVFQSDSGVFSAGVHTLKITVPNSMFQVDFALGPVLPAPTPSGSNSYQGRLIAAANGGFGSFGTSTISGLVFVDTNNDGKKGIFEAGLAGVPLELKGTDYKGNAVDLFATTTASGSYTFSNVPASNLTGYTIVDLITQIPLGQQYDGGVESVGSLGGTAGVNQILGVFVNSNQNGQNYNFGVRKKP
jgi:uncharacterized repeat protein (TIGR01451 family)